MVVGAGATRGAQFVVEGPGHSSGCLPPLNADFFTQLQRIRNKPHQKTVSGVIRDVVKLYGANFSLTLEEYFTQLEAMLTMAEVARPTSKLLNREEIAGMRQRLLDGLYAVLEESADVTRRIGVARANPCAYHDAIVGALRPRDTVISFNYDCVMDDALRRVATGQWSARHGYCFPSKRAVDGWEVWSAEDPPPFNSTINLLKLHGSLNWFPIPDGRGDIRLRERPYRQRGRKLYEIVPPEHAKRIDRPVFQHIWGHAALAIRRAKTLVFVGFSFTPTDLHVEALFRLALAEHSPLRQVVIANPSQDHRRRIRHVVSQALRSNATVVQFDTLRELAPRLDELLVR